MPVRRDSEILPVEEIKYVFNGAVLQPGDILLMNTYHETQRKVMERYSGSCIYDHAALYIGDAFLMEANGLGVVMNHIYSYGFKAEKDGCIMRLKNQSPATVSNVIYNAKAFMGMEFDGNEAHAVPANRDTDKEDTSNRTFCSRLVSQCFSDEGIKLFRNPNYCSPDDFLNCEQLERVEPSLMPFTSEMEATVMNAQNQRVDFKSATYWATTFQQFSSLYGEDIQTMAQLIAAASRHIDRDDAALSIIANNHLFEPVEDRKAHWPWLDKDEDFFSHFPTMEKQMFFLICQFLHFDETYLPSLKQNFASISVAESMCPQSKLIERIALGFKDILKETIQTRKRLAELYRAVANHDKDGFKKFAKQYGLYKDFEYVETPLCIDHILHDMMKASNANSHNGDK